MHRPHLPPPSGALLHFATYWLLGLPLGVLLGFHFGLGALGLWMGVASATACQAVALHAWVAARLDWRAEVKRSQATLTTLLDSHAVGDLDREEPPGVAEAASAEDEGAGLAAPLLGGGGGSGGGGGQ
jgi:hypothetical protein